MRLLALLFSTLLLAGAPPPFLAKPYLQLGRVAGPDTLALCWHGADRDEPWSVTLRAGPGRPWGPAIRPSWFRVAVPSQPAHRVYSATLRAPSPAGRFEYRVQLGARTVFRATAPGRKAPGEPQRVAVTGDLATTGRTPGPSPWPCTPSTRTCWWCPATSSTRTAGSGDTGSTISRSTTPTAAIRPWARRCCARPRPALLFPARDR